MAMNMKNDFFGKMKRHQAASVERTSIAENTDQSKVKIDKSYLQQPTEQDQRREFLSLLKKYKVDPDWLKQK